MFGEAPLLVLREDTLTVDDDVEHAAPALDEVGPESENLSDLGPQTGGLRLVVSTDAILYLNLHAGSSFDASGPGTSARP